MTSAAVPADHVVLDADHETVAAVEEKAKLQKHFGRFDMFFFLICTLVGLDTLGAVASNGAQGFTWLIFLGRLLLRPVRAADRRARLDVHRGGRPVHLDEARVRALRRRRSTSVLYWLSNPIWLGGTLTITAVDDVRRRSSRPRQRREVHLRARLHLVRRVGGDPLLRRRQVDPDDRRVRADRRARRSSRSRWSSTRSSTACTASAAATSSRPGRSSSPLVPVLFFNYVGFELPNAAGDEMKDPQKDVPFTVLRSAIGAGAALRRADPRDPARAADRARSRASAASSTP